MRILYQTRKKKEKKKEKKMNSCLVESSRKKRKVDMPAKSRSETLRSTLEDQIAESAVTASKLGGSELLNPSAVAGPAFEMRVLRNLEVLRMGTMSYLEALKLQEKLVADRKIRKIPDTLVSLQHPPTYTLGKRRTDHNLLIPETELIRIGAELHYTQRGGDITYHGPHQAILYPIIALRDMGLGARKYVEKLESTMIDLASLYGVKACPGNKCETGVWVGDRKIGAIGVRISYGITSHGLAFNIDPDLNYFKHIVPCGIANKDVTSLTRETDLALPTEEVVQDQLISCFARQFGYSDLVWKDAASILSESGETE